MSMKDHGCRFVFFLGAGCSVSSEVPTASTLVKRWLPKLKKLKTGVEDDASSWATTYFEEYSDNDAAKFYGKVMEDLFTTSKSRQTEIERLMEGKDPAYGYAVLSRMLSDEKIGSHFNIVLTTNFDDLLADALYLYTNTKPLVIYHESLVNFVTLSRTRPLIVKLHGDARLEPKNVEDETNDLEVDVKNVLKKLLSETGLIFIGYGGNDNSIAIILESLEKDSLPWGVYWVGNNLPSEKMTKWLEKRKSTWVKHQDFDELMLLFQHEFDLKQPSKKRFDDLIFTYHETMKKLQRKIRTRPHSMAKEILEKAMDELAKKLTDSEKVILEADGYERTDPDHANEIYSIGLDKFPNNVRLHMAYADFLHFYRPQIDLDEAEKHIRDAIKLSDGKDFSYFTALGILLKDKGKVEEAEKSFKNGLKDGTQFAILHYAGFLTRSKQDYEKALIYYEKAKKINENDLSFMIDFSDFLYVTDKIDESKKLIEKTVIESQGGDEELYAQLLKYAICGDEEVRKQCLKRFNELLKKYLKIFNWEYVSGLEKATKINNLNPKFVEELKKVAYGRNFDLKKFKEWNEVNS